MSGVSLPVTRPAGRALLVGNPTSRGQPLGMLVALGYACTEADDPYNGLLALCLEPREYAAVILSLSSVYREELQVIATIKRNYAHLDIWLAQTDGRHAAMAEALRLGADGLLAEDGLHRIGFTPPDSATRSSSIPALTEQSQGEDFSSNGSRRQAHNTQVLESDFESDLSGGEPVLTAEELRALLQEQPVMPPRGNDH